MVSRNKNVLMTYGQVMKKVMKGAGTYSEEKFSYQNTTYTVLVHKDTTDDGEIEYTIVQQVHNHNNKPHCVRAEINDDILYITSIKKWKACVHPAIDSYQGVILTRFLIKRIKKEYPHIKTVELTDYATIDCNTTRRTSIILSDKMLLTHGKSYYAMIGLKPKGEDDAKYYKRVQQILKQTTWDPKKLQPFLDTNVELPPLGTPFQDAMKFMFTNHCDLMGVAMRNYMKSLGIPRSIRGFEYVMKF